mmetsp:Transcript_5815/g.9581  ORF Transcript_5815/g.9581 Transcript_5815/m.9581 type:complete len:259 (+) Transcript_5815:817-1593(+)
MHRPLAGALRLGGRGRCGRRATDGALGTRPSARAWRPLVVPRERQHTQDARGARRVRRPLPGASRLRYARRRRVWGRTDAHPPYRRTAQADQAAAGDAVGAARLGARGVCQPWPRGAGHALQEPDAQPRRHAVRALRRGAVVHRLRVARAHLVRSRGEDAQGDDRARLGRPHGLWVRVAAAQGQSQRAARRRQRAVRRNVQGDRAGGRRDVHRHADPTGTATARATTSTRIATRNNRPADAGLAAEANHIRSKNGYVS